MYLTTKIHIDQHCRDKLELSTLYYLCYHAARMYNVGLYSVRQHFFNTGKFLYYNDNYHECKTNENYKLLLTDTGQQILRLVDRDFHSFFSLLNLKKEGKYSEKVNIPHYKDKNGVATFAVQGRSVRLNGDKFRIGLTKEFREKYNVDSRYIEFTIPKHLRGVEKFKEVRVIPLYGGKEFTVELVYEAAQARQIPETADGYLSIDLGLDNLMACTVFSNGQSRQFLIDGVKHLVIGYNKGQKQEVNMGSVNNQNFTAIPYAKLRQKLQYKCELHGIEYCPQEESYTSKASAIDGDFIPVYGKEITDPVFNGKRIKRGLYKSKDGLLLNADINGSVNILRKYLDESKRNASFGADRITALVNMPCRRIRMFGKPNC